MTQYEFNRLLSVPARYPLTFAVVFFPAVASVITGSMIYHFTFVFLLPLFWCFFTSLFLVEGVKSGRLSDNSGTVIRSANPIRFWGKVGFWSAIYLFSAYFCVGCARQEQRNAALSLDLPASGARLVPAATNSLDRPFAPR